MGQEKDFAALGILEGLEEYFLETLLAWLKPPSLSRTFCSQSTAILGSSFKINQQQEP